MNRLTCKTTNGYCDMQIATRENKLEKLGQLEDIEEELGIDLVIFKKIKAQGFIYGKYKNEIRKFTTNHFTFDNILAYTKLAVGSWLIRVKFPFNQYGRTWALTKEELEK